MGGLTKETVTNGRNKRAADEQCDANVIELIPAVRHLVSR